MWEKATFVRVSTTGRGKEGYATEGQEPMNDCQLHEIANRVSSRSDADIREDVYQECWVKFLRYQPRTPAGAWLMAVHARNDHWRRLMRTRKKDALAGIEVPSKAERQRAANYRYYQSRRDDPEWRAKKRRQHREWYWRNHEQAKAQSRERVRRHRAKQEGRDD